MAVRVNIKELNARLEELAGDVMLLGAAFNFQGKPIPAEKCSAIMDRLIESKRILDDVAKLGIKEVTITEGKIVWKDLTPNQKILQNIKFKNIK